MYILYESFQYLIILFLFNTQHSLYLPHFIIYYDLGLFIHSKTVAYI